MIDGRVGIIGVDRIDKKLLEVGHAADDLSSVWPEVGAFFAKRQRELFAKGGRPKWKPLSPRYVVARRKDGFGGRTLVRTGVLRDAVTKATPAKQTDHYALFGPAEKTVGWWALHKHGTRRMPRRDPLPAFNKAERKTVRDLIAEHIVKGVT